MRLPLLTEIEDRSRIAQCRRQAKLLAKTLGFDEVNRERVGIAVTEAVSNVIRHAGRGSFLAQPLEAGGERSLAIIVWDRGPGISNLGQCLQDGFSTAGGQGIGLGAMKRQADRFEAYSKPTGGLVVSMTFRNRGADEQDATWDLFATAIPMPQEPVSGDAWAFVETERVLKVLLVDGLGHGAKAEKAASLAVSHFEEVGRESGGEELIHSLNETLKKSRGAVAAVAEIDFSAGRLRYTGVGNIFGRLFSEKGAAHLISTSGTVGYQIRRPRSYEYDWRDDSVMILHSDGVGSRWDLGKFPGLAYSKSATIAGCLLSDNRKSTDDSSIVAVRSRREGGLLR